MKRAMRSFCLGLAVVPLATILAGAVLTTPAQAGCGDAPAAGVDWSKCEKRRLILRGRDLSKGVFQRTDFGRTDLADANLAGADLSEAIFERARLAGADLSGALLTKADGDRADFSKAILKGADLSKVEMSRTDFTGADLTGANLQKAELGRADLSDSKLDGADMTRAEIARAVFSGASLKGADMSGAYTYLTHFESTDLSVVKGLTQQQLDAACGDAETQLPAGLTPPDNWPCAAE